jgi:ATP-dependent helicase HrpA
MLFDASFVWDSSTPLEEKQFIQFKEKGTRLLQSFLPRAKKTAHDIFVLHEVLRTENKSYPGIQEDLKRLLPADFPTGVPFDKFEHIPRYLRAIQIRAERASLRPHQDAQKALSVGIFSEWEKKVPDQNKPSFRWLLEEYRVSLFAQELGTAETVSVQRLKQLGNFG